MNSKEVDKIKCNNFSLFRFVSVVDAIRKKCEEKEALGIQNIYDSDIRDIKECLSAQNIEVKYSYIENVLDFLTKI